MPQINRIDDVIAPKSIPEEHLGEYLACVRNIVHVQARATGEKPALLRLHHLLGDNLSSPDLPAGANHDLKIVREVLTAWVQGQIDDQTAINQMSVGVWCE